MAVLLQLERALRSFDRAVLPRIVRLGMRWRVLRAAISLCPDPRSGARTAADLLVQRGDQLTAQRCLHEFGSHGGAPRTTTAGGTGTGALIGGDNSGGGGGEEERALSWRKQQQRQRLLTTLHRLAVQGRAREAEALAGCDRGLQVRSCGGVLTLSYAGAQ